MERLIGRSPGSVGRGHRPAGWAKTRKTDVISFFNDNHPFEAVMDILSIAMHLATLMQEGHMPFCKPQQRDGPQGGIVTLIGAGRNELAGPGWRDETVT